MSENQEPTKPIIVNDAMPSIPEALRLARERAEQLRKGEFRHTTREGQEKMSMNTLLRRGGVSIGGIHPTDDRGQYDASRSVGANEPCPCQWAADNPHKFKRHAKVTEPLIRAALDKALVDFKAKEAAKATAVPTESIEPSTRST